MKKFIKTIFIFSFPIILFLISIEILLRRIPNDYAYKANYLNKNAGKLEVLFLGNSHTYYGIAPQFIRYKSFNASHIAQSLQCDAAIFKKYLPNLQSLKVIVIPIDYFSLYYSLEKSGEPWRKKNYNIYYNLKVGNSISDYFEITNSMFNGNLHRVKAFFLHNTNDIYCNNSGWGTNYNSSNNQDLIKTGLSNAQRNTVNNYDYFQLNINVLNEVIEIAKSKNIKIILFTSPAYKTETMHFNQKQLDTTIAVATNLATTNKNVKYYNFTSDTAFVDKDFYDADHLNEIGARKFSLKINELINEISINN